MIVGGKIVIGLVDFLRQADSFLLTSRTDIAPLMGGSSVFFALFSNLAIFIVMVAVYGILDERLERRGLLRRQAAIGFVSAVALYIFKYMTDRNPEPAAAATNA